MLRTLGISHEQMDLAMSSLGQEAAPEDGLAAVLWQFQKNDRDLPLDTMPRHHTLWFYLWQNHQEAFSKYVHASIQQHYLPKEPNLLERFRRAVNALWP